MLRSKPRGRWAEALGAVPLAAERLDHPDPDGALLRHLGDHAHALLHVDQDGFERLL